MISLAAVEAYAGDAVYSTTMRQLAGQVSEPAASLLLSAVADPDATVHRALTADVRFRSFWARSPLARRALMANAMQLWARGVSAAREAGSGASSAAASSPAGRRWALPEGPLQDFVEEHGLDSLLDTPVDRLIELFEPRDYFMLKRSGATLREAAVHSRAAWPLVRHYLDYCVDRIETVERRKERWSCAPASEALRELASRVRRAYQRLDFEEPPPPTRVADIEEVFDEEGLEYRVSQHVGLGHRGVAVSLERADETGAALVETKLLPSHPLIRVTLEWLLDILHDPGNPTLELVRRLVETPPWQRILERVGATLADESEPAVAETRLFFRVYSRDEFGPGVEPVIQKRTARGRYSKGRTVSFAALRAGEVAFEAQDERVLAAAFRLFGAAREYDYELSPDASAELVESLVGHSHVQVGELPGRVVRRHAEVVVDESEGELRLGLRVGDVTYSPESASSRFFGSRFVAVDEARALVEVAAVDPTLAFLFTSFRSQGGVLPTDAGDALVGVLTRLRTQVGLELPASLAGTSRDADPRPLVRAEPLLDGGLRAQVFVRPLGAGPLQLPGEGPSHLVATVRGERVHTTRDLTAERKAFDALLAAGLDAASPEGEHVRRFEEPDDAVAFIEALAARPELATLEWPEDQAGWRVSNPGRVNLGLRRAEHWFEANAELDIDEGKVSLAALVLALRENRRFVAIGKGRFARIAGELRAQLEALAPVVHVRGQSAHVAPSAASHLDAVLGAEGVRGDAAWRGLQKRLRAAANARPEPPPGLEATLRDYQVEGVTWLLRTASWAEGACLADEMGLGKTLQALALLLSRASEGPSLVVCPTSLSDNWAQECARFAPSLRPVLYRGADRASSLGTLAAGDLLIASYDVVARDREALAATPFAVLVLDEAQAIKNPAAARTKAVGELRASFRLALTGTPIENRLSEVFSLYSVLAPGLLGQWESFRARFVVPIEKHGDSARLAQLRDLVRPFLLRRTKALVARELPPRTETVRPVELNDDERALYEAQRKRALELLEKRRSEPEFRFALLAELTRLRRLVCHPALVVEDSTARSSKLEELLSLLDDLRREQHRALVFSQFTSLLAFVRRALEARRVDYLYLDGSTPAEERAVLVRRWQEGDAPVFLISLKAGGTGLNLTAADYVIHLDPWWNPAVEDQASDRAHRIGQTKPVTVVRLVAQGTIEERVLAMHEEKRALASGILEGSETTAALGEDELLALLSDGEPPSGATKRAPGRNR